MSDKRKFYAPAGNVLAEPHPNGNTADGWVMDFGPEGVYETTDPYEISRLEKHAANPLHPITDKAPTKTPTKKENE